jgi:hypothetical protein
MTLALASIDAVGVALCTGVFTPQPPTGSARQARDQAPRPLLHYKRPRDEARQIAVKIACLLSASPSALPADTEL